MCSDCPPNVYDSNWKIPIIWVNSDDLSRVGWELCDQKCISWKKWPRTLDMVTGKTHPPQVWAMPERKHFFLSMSSLRYTHKQTNSYATSSPTSLSSPCAPSPPLDTCHWKVKCKLRTTGKSNIPKTMTKIQSTYLALEQTRVWSARVSGLFLCRQTSDAFGMEHCSSSDAILRVFSAWNSQPILVVLG